MLCKTLQESLFGIISLLTIYKISFLVEISLILLHFKIKFFHYISVNQIKLHNDINCLPYESNIKPHIETPAKTATDFCL